MKHNFSIDKIEFACLVGAGEGETVHKNRKSHGLALFLRGERTFNFENKKLNVTNNAVVYLPKGSNYAVIDADPSECYAINFQMSDEVSFEPFAFKIKKSELLLQHFKNALKSFIAKRPGYDSQIKAELYGIIYNMQAEYCIPYGNAAVIQPAIDFIHSNYYKETISVKYLASLCGISTVHLNNTFVKVFAMTPMKYINTLRMTRAKELLASQMYTVGEVCFLSGFNDESYFSREFKRWFDVPPSKYS